MKLYVLAIGINQFLGNGIANLDGCENDAKGVFNYLKRASKQAGIEMDGELLLTSAATKKNIVGHFQQHLGQAKKGDVAVFYFSGHGAEEENETFARLSDEEKITTLVCHDSRKNGVTDLADKEIRYLIHQITGKEDAPHFVLITDSCHSGSVTRDGNLMPRLTEVTNERDWSGFIFAEKLSKAQAEQAQTLNEILPQGQHIHLAACLDTQLAYEIEGNGVFTSTMLDVLKRSEGQISYNDLFDRMWEKIALSPIGKKQTPMIHAIEGDENDVEQLFLGGSTKNKTTEGTIHFDTKKRKWSLDIGAIQGLTSKDFRNVEVDVFDLDGNIFKKGTIQKVLTDRSFLYFENDEQLDERATYSVDLKGIYREPVGFYLNFKNHEKAMKRLQEMFLSLSEAEWISEYNLQLTDGFAVADYMVSVQNEHFIISKTSDNRHRPVVEQQSIHDFNAFDEVPEMMKDIAHFHFVEKINNPQTKLHGQTTNSPAATIEVYRVHDKENREKDELLPVEAGNMVYINNGDDLSIRTINHTRRKTLYFSLMAMNGLYGIDTGMLGKASQAVAQGDDLWLWEREVFDLYHDDHIIPFEFPETRLTLKLFASEEPFKLNRLNQDSLPFPTKEKAEPTFVTRKLKRRSQPEADWMVYTLHIVIENKKK